MMRFVRFVLLALLILTPTMAFAAPPMPICTIGQNDAPSAAGYCVYGFWTPGVIDYSTYIRVPPTHFVTRALYQAEGVAERTAELKGYDTSAVEGLVSLLSPSTAGWTFWLKAPEHDWIKVMDVDSVELPYYYFHIVNADSAVELSYALAVELGNIEYRDANGDRYFDVEICLTSDDPVGVCGSDVPVNYRDWFLQTATWGQ